MINSPISMQRISLDGTGTGATSDDKLQPSPIYSKPPSPAQCSYAQNQHFNNPSGSLVTIISPSSSSSWNEHQKVIREAASMLCKEVKMPPAHISGTDWENVSIRMQNLARLEQLWAFGSITVWCIAMTPTVLQLGGYRWVCSSYQEAS